jgi:hypothetical protein
VQQQQDGQQVRHVAQQSEDIHGLFWKLFFFFFFFFSLFSVRRRRRLFAGSPPKNEMGFSFFLGPHTNWFSPFPPSLSLTFQLIPFPRGSIEKWAQKPNKGRKMFKKKFRREREEEWWLS